MEIEEIKSMIIGILQEVHDAKKVLANLKNELKATELGKA